MNRAQLLHWAYPWARRYWRLSRPITLGARALVVEGDQVLLVRHTYGDPGEWTLPGGSVQRNETVVDTALRELWEECAVHAVADPWPLLGLFYDRDEGKHDHIAVVVCHAERSSPQPGYPEIAEAAWHAADALPRVASGVPTALEAYRLRQRGLGGPW
jgi:8-oxo-dGTP pyrophosphatase MutT (NUDIX family)